MPSFDITDPLPNTLGTPVAAESGGAIGAISDVNYDVFVGGQGFLLATSDSFPYNRATRPIRKDQVDITNSPGEQTLSDWWVRSQQSFHGGAGVDFIDPAQSNGSELVRFNKSAGVDVWTKGKLSLLKDTTNLNTVGVAGFATGYDVGGAPGVLHCHGTQADRSDGSAVTAATWGGTGNIVSVCDDGTSAYIADDIGIWKMGLGSGTGTQIWSTGTTDVVVGFAKQRLVAGIGPSVYELVTGGPSLPAPLYTHPNTSWKWTAIAEGPGAVYAAGYAGARSAIFKFVLEVDGALPVLSSGTVVAELPTGEVVHSLLSYLGSYLGIGTSAGLRVAFMDTSGDIQYGPLTVETTFPVRAMTAQDRFLYAGVEGHIDGKSGLVRVDLSTEVEPGRFAWANDLQSTENGAVYGVSLFGTSGRLVFTTPSLFLEHATDLVSAGYLDTGLIRFSTLEAKQFLSVLLRGMVTAGSVAVSSKQTDGDLITMATYTAASDLAEAAAVRPSQPQDSLAFQFLLVRDSGDTSRGPTLYGYQAKATPVPKSSGEDIRLPILMFDFLKDASGRKYGWEGYAAAQYASLLEKYPGVVTYQDLRSGETIRCALEGIEFAQTSPAKNTSGFGGVCYLTLRTVVN